MYRGYLELAGIEVINAMRTYAYARNAGVRVENVYDAPDLPALLLHDEYRTPALDGAPWYNAHVPDSNNFFGWMPTALTGFDDDTTQATATELVSDGGVSSIERQTSREMRVKGVLVAKDEHALEYGLSWLRGVFASANLRAGYECMGETLTFLASTPEVCDEAIPPLEPAGPDTPYHECLVGYLRQFHRVTTLQGVKVVKEFPRDACPRLVEVEVVLSAGVPHIYTWPIDVGRSQLEPTLTVENLVPNPAPQAGSTYGYTAAPDVTLTAAADAGWPTNTSLTAEYSGTHNGQEVWVQSAVLPGIAPGEAHTILFHADTTPAASGTPGVLSRRVQVLYKSGGVSQTVITSPVLLPSTGEADIRWEFTLPVTATEAVVRIHAHTDRVKIGGLLVARSGTLGDAGFFYGGTADDGHWTYEWEGTPHQSKSLAYYNPSPPFTIPNVVCDPDVDPVVLRRNGARIPGPDVSSTLGWLNAASAPTRFNVARVSSGTLAADANGYASTQAMRSTRTSTSPDALILSMRGVGGNVEVEPQQQTYYSVWAMSTQAGAIVSGTVGFYPASGTGNIGSTTLANRTLPAANTWYRLDWTFTPPVGCYILKVDMTVRVASGNAPSGSQAFLSSVLAGPTTQDNTTYFDGSTPQDATYTYRWEGALYESPSVAHAQSSDPLRDPDCAFIPLPPQPPIVMDECLESPEDWVRYSVPIPDDIPGYALVPLLELSSGADAVRQVRLRLYPAPESGGAQAIEECAYIGEWVVAYVPPGSTLVIDSRTRTAYVDFGSDRRSALHLLRGSDGKPFVWPVAEGGRPYYLTADFVPASDDTSVRVFVAGRT